MAVLSEADRQEIWAEFMRAAREYAVTINITKADLRAAFDAVDDNLETSAGAINNWFPEPAKSSLGARPKAYIVGLVAMQRALRS